jgi:hypothetical protein
MREELSGSPQPSEGARVATATITPGIDAARIALEPVKWGEAPQVSVAGDTGAGKTTAMLAIVEEYLRVCPGVVIVVDDKGPRTRYVGHERRDVADLRANPIPSGDGRRVIVFRGEVMKRINADREEITKFAWDMAVRGKKVLLVNDEAKHSSVVKNRQWRKGVSYIPDAYTKGREVGLGNLWGSQGWDDMPDEPCSQCVTVLHFKTDGDGLAKLRENKLLRGGAEAMIPRLHAMESPPAQRGDFVCLVRGRDWNGRVYKFPA